MLVEDVACMWRKVARRCTVVSFHDVLRRLLTQIHLDKGASGLAIEACICRFKSLARGLRRGSWDKLFQA